MTAENEVYTVIVCPGCEEEFCQRNMYETKAKNGVFVCKDCWESYEAESAGEVF